MQKVRKQEQVAFSPMLLLSNDPSGVFLFHLVLPAVQPVEFILGILNMLESC